MQTILNQEGIIRMAVFLGVMVAMMVLEAVLPRRQRGLERRQRWPANLGIVVADTLLARLII
ncbi:MAG: sterol desaturase family protein, partial [Rhodospirillales bacterium]|nr:sterol desaturase family protein [Rhodospirillales bacterium]